jgi:hypothetical protein
LSACCVEPADTWAASTKLALPPSFCLPPQVHFSTVSHFTTVHRLTNNKEKEAAASGGLSVPAVSAGPGQSQTAGAAPNGPQQVLSPALGPSPAAGGQEAATGASKVPLPGAGALGGSGPPTSTSASIFGRSAQQQQQQRSSSGPFRGSRINAGAAAAAGAGSEPTSGLFKIGAPAAPALSGAGAVGHSRALSPTEEVASEGVSATATHPPSATAPGGSADGTAGPVPESGSPSGPSVPHVRGSTAGEAPGAGPGAGGDSPSSPEERGLLLTPKDEQERLLSLQVALKCADLGHLAESLPVHLQWVKCLEEEVRRGRHARTPGAHGWRVTRAPLRVCSSFARATERRPSACPAPRCLTGKRWEPRCPAAAAMPH